MKRVFLVGIMLFSLGSVIARGEMLVSDRFDGASLAAWRAYSNDDGNKSGWSVSGGVASQDGVNKDEQTGGERFLLKYDVLDFSKCFSPISLALDLQPRFFANPSDVWCGLCLFAREPHPSSGEIVVALRYDTVQDVSGLQIGIQGQGWLGEPSPCDVGLGSWGRLLVRLEPESEGHAIKVRAKCWKRESDEQEGWTCEVSVPFPEDLEERTGIGLACGAELGNNECPKASFDNFALVSVKGDLSNGNSLTSLSPQEADASTDFKLEEDFSDGILHLPWKLERSEYPIIVCDTAPEGSNGYAMKVGGIIGYDTAYVEDTPSTHQVVEALIYIPVDGAPEASRIGIFARGRSGSFLGNTNCAFLLTADTNTGQVRVISSDGDRQWPFKLVDSSLVRLNQGWHWFRLSVVGEEIRAFTDGKLIASAMSPACQGGMCAGIYKNDPDAESRRLNYALVDRFRIGVSVVKPEKMARLDRFLGLRQLQRDTLLAMGLKEDAARCGAFTTRALLELMEERPNTMAERQAFEECAAWWDVAGMRELTEEVMALVSSGATCGNAVSEALNKPRDSLPKSFSEVFSTSSEVVQGIAIDDVRIKDMSAGDVDVPVDNGGFDDWSTFPGTPNCWRFFARDGAQGVLQRIQREEAGSKTCNYAPLVSRIPGPGDSAFDCRTHKIPVKAGQYLSVSFWFRNVGCPQGTKVLVTLADFNNGKFLSHTISNFMPSSEWKEYKLSKRLDPSANELSIEFRIRPSAEKAGKRSTSVLLDAVRLVDGENKDASLEVVNGSFEEWSGVQYPRPASWLCFQSDGASGRVERYQRTASANQDPPDGQYAAALTRVIGLPGDTGLKNDKKPVPAPANRKIALTFWMKNAEPGKNTELSVMITDLTAQRKILEKRYYYLSSSDEWKQYTVLHKTGPGTENISLTFRLESPLLGVDVAERDERMGTVEEFRSYWKQFQEFDYYSKYVLGELAKLSRPRTEILDQSSMRMKAEALLRRDLTLLRLECEQALPDETAFQTLLDAASLSAEFGWESDCQRFASSLSKTSDPAQRRRAKLAEARLAAAAERDEDALEAYEILVASCSQEDQILTQMFDEWVSLLEKNLRYDDAIEACSRFLVLCPKGEKAVEAQLKLAENLYARSSYADVLKRLDSMSPEGVKKEQADRADLLRSLALMELDAVDKACEILTGLSSKAENEDVRAKAHFMLGYCAVTKGDYDGANSIFEGFLKKYPDHPNAAEARKYIQVAR